MEQPDPARAGGHQLPSAEGYQQVISRAPAQAGISPSNVGYVEAHGNGTPACDQIDLQAIGALIGTGRPTHPAHPPGPPTRPAHPPGRPTHPAGSAKPNLGRSEAAAGVIGLVKTAFVLRHRHIPASPHCPDPTSAVAWHALNIAPVPYGLDWPVPGKAIAGINTYGLSGTVVHLLPGEACAQAGGERPPRACNPGDWQWRAAVGPDRLVA